MLLRLLFTALDRLPRWITSLLLRFVHEITGIKLITERIGHASDHEPGKKDGEKKYTVASSDGRPYIPVVTRVWASLTGQWAMRHQDPDVGAFSLANQA